MWLTLLTSGADGGAKGAEGAAAPAQVFPQLYLPVMEEAIRRVLAPWRSWLPTPATFLFASRMRRLNSFILQLLRKRWAARVAGDRPPQPDVLERILASIQVPESSLLRRIFRGTRHQSRLGLHRTRRARQPCLTYCILQLARSEAGVVIRHAGSVRTHAVMQQIGSTATLAM